jgi:hypothetical protein
MSGNTLKPNRRVDANGARYIEIAAVARSGCANVVEYGSSNQKNALFASVCKAEQVRLARLLHD